MKYIVNIIFMLVFVKSNAQPVIIDWEKSFGGSSIDRGHDIKALQDGGFVFCAETESVDSNITFNHGGKDYWIVRLDSSGNLLWQKTYGGSGYDLPTTINNTVENGFVIYGETGSNDQDVVGFHTLAPGFPVGQPDGWLCKIDSIGNLLWQKCYGGTDDDQGIMLRVTDSKYLICSDAWSTDGDIPFNHGLDDFWLSLTDSTGSIIWTKTFGSANDDGPFACAALTDSAFLIGGGTTTDFGGLHGTPGQDVDMGIVKVDLSGNMIWTKCYGGSGLDYANDFLPLPNGNFLILGTTSSDDGDMTVSNGSDDFWLSKVSSNGTILWQHSYGGNSYDFPYQIKMCSDGGYVMVGSTWSTTGDITFNHGGIDIWVVKVDSIGNLQWQKTFGGSDDDEGYSIEEISPDQFIVCGYSKSHDGDVSINMGEDDVWIIKFSSVINAIKPSPEETELIEITQFEQKIIVQLNEPKFDTYNVTLTDFSGKLIYQNKLSSNISLFTIPKPATSGVYIINFINSEKVITKKIVINNY
jgi:hypothetical protein